MTRDEIIAMMNACCDADKVPAYQNGFCTLTQEELERFAQLVAEKEREALTAPVSSEPVAWIHKGELEYLQSGGHRGGVYLKNEDNDSDLLPLYLAPAPSQQSKDLSDEIRYLRKWLNEENTAPIDRTALAKVLHQVSQNEAKDAKAAAYNELINAVGNKYPEETRHQTALRYIRRAEELKNCAAIDAAMEGKS